MSPDLVAMIAQETEAILDRCAAKLARLEATYTGPSPQPLVTQYRAAISRYATEATERG